MPRSKTTAASLALVSGLLGAAAVSALYIYKLRDRGPSFVGDDDRNSNGGALTRHTNIRRIRKQLHFECKLSFGATGKVIRARYKKSKRPCAVKIVNKGQFRHRFNDPQLELLRAEVEILRSIEHQHVIGLFDVFETHNNVYVVMELASGGDLFQYIKNVLHPHPHPKLSPDSGGSIVAALANADAVHASSLVEEQAKRVVFQITSALMYLHTEGIMHRDVKPENILIVNKVSDVHDAVQVKLCDFGLSTFFSSSRSRRRNKQQQQRQQQRSAAAPVETAAHAKAAVPAVQFGYDAVGKAAGKSDSNNATINDNDGSGDDDDDDDDDDEHSVDHELDRAIVVENEVGNDAARDGGDVEGDPLSGLSFGSAAELTQDDEPMSPTTPNIFTEVRPSVALLLLLSLMLLPSRASFGSSCPV